MKMKRYGSPIAFKQALEHRLKASTTIGTEIARRRQLLVFDRFLARVCHTFGDAAIVKGGLVLELRLARARTTKDVDLRLMGSPEEVLERLQAAGRLDLGDYMRFEVQQDPHHPTIENDGVRYEGFRFRTECRLGGKIYGSRFGVDVAFADPIVGEPDTMVANDLLDFANIPPPTLRIYPVVSHIAEKLHAYTLPRSRPNSRIKDLPDLALLASAHALDVVVLRRALEQTFSFRATHMLPEIVPEPPAFWAKPYAKMAQTDGLPWPTTVELHRVVCAFLDPVLALEDCGLWNPEAWRWQPTPEHVAQGQAKQRSTSPIPQVS